MGTSRTHHGRYKPKNPEKYKGDISNIQWRSYWEFKFMVFLDTHKDILRWNSEEVIIPYTNPIDGRRRRYFPDFWMEKLNLDGVKEQVIVEIKPFAQTQEPKPKHKITKQYLTEVSTWGLNSAKWSAAQKFCEKKNMKFLILTEKELFAYK